MKTIAIIQARTGSSRLPGKVLMNLGGKPDIHWVVMRAKACVEIDETLLATTDCPEDDALAEWAKEENVPCFRGSEEDVLKRYYDAAVFAGAVDEDVIVRITGDCPLIDPEVCAEVIRLLKNTGADYASNIDPPTFPDGLDCEAMRFSALKKAHTEAKLKYEREHVTQYILKNSAIFKKANYCNREDLSALRWTLDELQDYAFLSAVFEGLDGEAIRMKDVCLYVEENPNLPGINAAIARNEGLLKSMNEENL